jgi:hypothetical protein
VDKVNLQPVIDFVSDIRSWIVIIFSIVLGYMLARSIPIPTPVVGFVGAVIGYYFAKGKQDTGKAELLKACKALQMEAAARGCGLRIADEAIEAAKGQQDKKEEGGK